MEIDQLNIIETPELDSKRIKTSQRMHYEAQVKVIIHQAGGDLESIRNKLGLSQRKMCQLLLVDPSAWTRWTKGSSDSAHKSGPSSADAPPHIYRALQWYLALQEKIPGLTPQYFIGKDPEVLHQQALAEVHKVESRLEGLMEDRILSQNQMTNVELIKRIAELENQIRANRIGFFMIVGAIGLLVVALLFYLRILPGFSLHL